MPYVFPELNSYFSREPQVTSVDKVAQVSQVLKVNRIFCREKQTVYLNLFHRSNWSTRSTRSSIFTWRTGSTRWTRSTR